MLRRWERALRIAGGVQRGQGVVEMALLTPLLVLILLGALDLGRVYIYSTRVNNAVKEAAATSLYQPEFGAASNRAYREVYDPVNQRKLLGEPGRDFVIDRMYRYKVTAPTTAIDCKANSSACLDPGPGDVIEVSGYYVFRPITSEILAFFPTNLPIRRTVRAVY
jgi:hypothetical protein